MYFLFKHLTIKLRSKACWELAKCKKFRHLRRAYSLIQRARSSDKREAMPVLGASVRTIFYSKVTVRFHENSSGKKSAERVIFQATQTKQVPDEIQVRSVSFREARAHASEALTFLGGQ